MRNLQHVAFGHVKVLARFRKIAGYEYRSPRVLGAYYQRIVVCVVEVSGCVRMEHAQFKVAARAYLVARAQVDEPHARLF